MGETQRALELSAQPPPQSEPEVQPQPPPPHQPPVPTQDPSETHQQAQLRGERRLTERQRQTTPPWINNRRLLLLLLGFFFCAAILGLIYCMHHDFQNRSGHQAGTDYPCLSPVCRRASERLATAADPFARPCDYFLANTCGSDGYASEDGWTRGGGGVAGHPRSQEEMEARPRESERRRGPREDKIPDRKSVLLLYLAEMLESNERPGGAAVRKAQRFHRSCLDTESIEAAGAEPLLALIQKLGGWAVSGQWDRADFNSTVSLLMKDYNTFPFFSLRVGSDPNETTSGAARRYVQIDQPDLLIPIEWNSKTQKSQAKTQTMRTFFASCQRYLALLGSPPGSSMIHVGAFISLSSELAVAAAPLRHRLSKGQLYQRMTVGELQSRAPAIDWLRCLRAAFHPMPLIDDDLVLLHNLPYVVQMSHTIGKWLNKHELRSSGPLHTYMIFHLLHTLMPALDSRFADTAEDLSVALGNSRGAVPRWRHCASETERGFDVVLGELLRETTAPRDAEEMIQNIFSSFKSKLQELRWNDRNSLPSVMKKVDSLIPKVWATKNIYSAAELDLLFSKVSVDARSFFSNYVQLLALRRERRSKLLTEQTEAADILSVMSLLRGNELLFPVGMFVPPLFHPAYPRAMNYGAVGFLVAKDILHLTLPDIHSQSDTVRAVGECVWAHYLSMTDKAGRGGVGLLSLSAAQQQEVWVQYSAQQIALQAYHRSLQRNPSDTSISGLSHTRLFLTSFAQVNCDSDPYRQFMPLEPSFLITVICAKSDLCPTRLQCFNKTQQHSLRTC